jgi:hypothetical protein
VIMRLNECRSENLLPRTPGVEARLAWCCAAFDTFIGRMDARRHALSAPFALEAVQSLTDAEIQQYYSELGLAPYYADISRTARENFLVAQWHYLRKLGTQDAVLALCQYIFGDNPVSLEIVDNLAFDDNGVLTDASLLNLYDAIVTADDPQLTRFQIARIFANITRFGRVTQKLRGLVMRFESDMTIYAGVGSLDSAMFYDNDWINCTLHQVPVSARVGIDTECAPGTISLKSPYYWLYEFAGGGTYNNLWNPNYYADSVNPTNPDPNYSSIPNSYYSNVWLWNGSNVFDLNSSGYTFKLAVYSGKPEFYTSNQDAVDAFNSACLIELAPGSPVFSQSDFSLPSDLYTINGTTITWNASHKLYQLFYGKTAEFVS